MYSSSSVPSMQPTTAHVPTRDTLGACASTKLNPRPTRCIRPPRRPLARKSTGRSTIHKWCNVGIKKKLVRLKKPRLPSALGLSGACGVAA
eukprot:scaffold30600_cov115-Isochrysis_galbana.AAC.1